MRKIRTFSAVLSLFLLVPASIIWAQTITQQKGLTTAVFTTPQGNIKVYLPDDIRHGDVISGRVVAEPEGKNEKQVQRNLAELVKYSIGLYGQKFTVGNASKTIQFIVQTGRPMQGTMDLLNANGTSPVQQLTIPAKPLNEQKPAPAKCIIPGHVLAGSPMTIRGSFDGNAANTQCSISNQPATILAESPRSCIVAFPENANGMQATQVQENGQQPCTKNISAVQMNVSAGKLNLTKGENTYIDVSITGLQNLPEPALLTLINITTDVVAMQPSNTVAIPLAPDSVSAGTFKRRFDVQSIKTGNFAVNVNLDFQDIMLTPVPDDKSNGKCNCSVTATVIKPTTINFRSFHASLQKKCGGQNCSEANVTAKWEVVSGKENIEFAEMRNGGESITVQPKNAGTFILKFSVTLTCSDGSTCTDVKFTNENGDVVKGPSTETEEEETGVTSEPKPKESGKKCKCGAKVGLQKKSIKGDIWTYEANVQAECKGVYGKGSSVIKCDVLKIEYDWRIASGEKVAEIDGKKDGSTTTVKIKGKGKFHIIVWVTVTCTDGSVCKVMADREEEIPDDPALVFCKIYTDEEIGYVMTGELNKTLTGLSSKSIFRDDVVTLYAEGKDADLLFFGCRPVDPCKETQDEKKQVLNSRVRFEWVITNAVGSFVKIGRLPEEQCDDDGDRVIFKPPYVPLPAGKTENTLTANLELRIVDDNLSQPVDVTVLQKIDITITRRKTSIDKYEVVIKPGAPTKAVTTSVQRKEITGSCKATAGKWQMIDKLPTPVIKLPGIPGSDTILLGQTVVLCTDDIRDIDKFPINCSSDLCITSSTNLIYEDHIGWKWNKVNAASTMDNGSLIVGSQISESRPENGRSVLYKAPEKLPEGVDMIEIVIKARVFNPEGVRKDEDSDWGEIKLNVYRPGVRLSTAPLTWLPTDKEKIAITSTLMVKAGKWVTAPLHAGRIHFFELLEVSTEKGICMNDPLPPKANNCRDLKLKDEEGHEGFNDAAASGCPDSKGYFLQTRTKIPQHSYSITVYSEDFGAYGFLRSYVNVYEWKSEKKGDDKFFTTWLETKGPSYTSVSLTREDVAPHPSMNIGRGKFDYPDNRVSIPLDIDNNHIADNGWKTADESSIPDPPWGYDDKDEEPIGDGFKGDGLSNYEEYRGFMFRKNVSEKTGSEVVEMGKDLHARTHNNIKTIFIRKKFNFNIDMYVSITKLEVFEISEQQYQTDDKRVVNFNYQPKSPTHLVDQKGLCLVNGGTHAKLMGIANTSTKDPARPNDVIDVVVYLDKVRSEVDRVNKEVAVYNAEPRIRKKYPDGLRMLDFDKKLNAVVAHELLHANAVWHHGEGDERLDISHDAMRGLRSGDLSCVMRYDNTGTKVKDTAFYSEKPGIDLCTSPEGTGYNEPDKKNAEKVDKVDERGYGNCSPGRGSCAFQIRISGVGDRPPSRKPK